MLYKAFYSSTGFAKFFLLNLSDDLFRWVLFWDKTWSPQRGWEAHWGYWGWNLWVLEHGARMPPWKVNAAILINAYFLLSAEAPVQTRARDNESRWPDTPAFSPLSRKQTEITPWIQSSDLECELPVAVPLGWLHHDTGCEQKLKAQLGEGKRSSGLQCRLWLLRLPSASKLQSLAEGPHSEGAPFAGIWSTHLG